MSYTVGLDFGTHQTKVCIEDASNPSQKIYEFFDFEDPHGSKTVLFPSILQINKNDTVSYGFVEESKCKTSSFLTAPKPTLDLPIEPKLDLPNRPENLSYPPKPKKQNLKGYSLKEQLIYQKNFEQSLILWKKQCKQVDEDNRNGFEDWELDCIAIKNDYNYDLEEYYSEKKKKLNDFENALTTWEKNRLPRKQLFRYFKLAVFSNQCWEYDIQPETISIWYLTYILFRIKEKYGNDFYTQLGVPHSMDTPGSDNQRSIAFKILIAANELMLEYNDLRSFMNAKYSELLKSTRFGDYAEKDIKTFGINVLPEAFAGLSSITQRGKLSRGMHLLTDIGGGTTDIAFFTITENKLPNIHAVLSFPQGLNYIFENYLEINNSCSIAEIQVLFRETQLGFDKAISQYHCQLIRNTKNMIDRIENEFKNRQHIHGFTINRLRDALSDRPIVYCGGGSMYESMRVSLPHFSDIMLINKEMVNIPYVKNKHIDAELFTILATSYGLSIQLENEIQMTPIENVFDHLPQKEDDNPHDWRNDHGLSDT